MKNLLNRIRYFIGGKVLGILNPAKEFLKIESPIEWHNKNIEIPTQKGLDEIGKYVRPWRPPLN